MFFVLSKTVAFLLLPSNFLFALALAGLALIADALPACRPSVLLIASFIVIVLAGVLPIGGALNYALEQRFPPWDPARGTPDGIIVLGGTIDPSSVAHLWRAAA